MKILRFIFIIIRFIKESCTLILFLFFPIPDFTSTATNTSISREFHGSIESWWTGWCWHCKCEKINYFQIKLFQLAKRIKVQTRSFIFQYVFNNWLVYVLFCFDFINYYTSCLLLICYDYACIQLLSVILEV